MVILFPSNVWLCCELFPDLLANQERSWIIICYNDSTEAENAKVITCSDLYATGYGNINSVVGIMYCIMVSGEPDKTKFKYIIAIKSLSFGFLL